MWINASFRAIINVGLIMCSYELTRLRIHALKSSFIIASRGIAARIKETRYKIIVRSTIDCTKGGKYSSSAKQCILRQQEKSD